MEIGLIIEYDGVIAQIIDVFYSADSLMLELSNGDVISAEQVSDIKA